MIYQLLMNLNEQFDLAQKVGAGNEPVREAIHLCHFTLGPARPGTFLRSY